MCYISRQLILTMTRLRKVSNAKPAGSAGEPSAVVYNKLKKDELNTTSLGLLTEDEQDTTVQLTESKKKWTTQQSRACNEILAKAKVREELDKYVDDLGSKLTEEDANFSQIIDNLEAQLGDSKVQTWIFEVPDNSDGHYILTKIKDAFTSALDSDNVDIDSLTEAMRGFISSNKAHKDKEDDHVALLIDAFEGVLQTEASDDSSELDDEDSDVGDDDGTGVYKDFDFFDPNP